MPKVLPGINEIDLPDEKGQNRPGTIAHAYRLRELAIQAMVEGSAKARLSRALNTRTTQDGRQLDLKVGDLVDFYRDPPQKDISGWYGPGKVTDISQITRGHLSLSFLGRIWDVAVKHVRHHHVYFAFLQSSKLRTAPLGAWQHIRKVVEEQSPRTLTHVGYMLAPRRIIKILVSSRPCVSMQRTT